MIPEKKRTYKPGETARLQVRTPFREATALVSIEAGGIIETLRPAAVALQAGDRIAGQGGLGTERVRVRAGRARPRGAAASWYSLFQWGWREPVVLVQGMVDPAAADRDGGLRQARLPDRPRGDRRRHGRFQAQGRGQQPTRRSTAPREEAHGEAQGHHARGQARAGRFRGRLSRPWTRRCSNCGPNESWDLLESLMLQKRAYEVETATAQSHGDRQAPLRQESAAARRGRRARARRANCSTRCCKWNPRVEAGCGAAAATLKVHHERLVHRVQAGGRGDCRRTNLFGTGSTRRASRRSRTCRLISGLPPRGAREAIRFEGAAHAAQRHRASQMNVSVATAKAGAQGAGGRAKP